MSKDQSKLLPAFSAEDIARFHAQVFKPLGDEGDECWVWTGTKTSSGYGQLKKLRPESQRDPGRTSRQ